MGNLRRLVSLLSEGYCNCVCLAVIYDDLDSIVGPLIKTLNISLTYYKDVYNLRTQIDLTATKYEEDASLSG